MLNKAEVREAILGIQRKSEQVLDRQSVDRVVSASFVSAALRHQLGL